VTLVLTTHYMDEAEQLCDRLVVMDQARIVAHGSPAQLIAQYSSREVAEFRFPVGAAETTGEALTRAVTDPEARVETLPDRLLVYVADGEAAVTQVREAGLHPLSTLVRRSTLEDVFLSLTGRSLVDC
jgi:lipooligosaccharide transport system ATP-binding protein